MPPRSGAAAKSLNNTPPLSDSGPVGARRILNDRAIRPTLAAMIRLAVPLALALAAAAPAGAQCYADYKAKRDDPLRLHYGVAEIRGECAPGPAAEEVARRIAEDGWTLLNVLGVFGPEGLDERRESAGRFFLRY